MQILGAIWAIVFVLMAIMILGNQKNSTRILKSYRRKSQAERSAKVHDRRD